MSSKLPARLSGASAIDTSPRPLQTVPNIIVDAGSQDPHASSRVVALQPEALATVPSLWTVTLRPAPSSSSTKSVDPRLRSVAPPGHPYSNHCVNSDGSRCPLDLFPSEASPPTVGSPPFTRFPSNPHAPKSERAVAFRLKVSIRSKLESTQGANPTSLRFSTLYDCFAALSRAETSSALPPG